MCVPLVNGGLIYTQVKSSKNACIHPKKQIPRSPAGQHFPANEKGLYHEGHKAHEREEKINMPKERGISPPLVKNTWNNLMSYMHNVTIPTLSH